MGETFQVSGARASYIYALETIWGQVAGSPNWRQVRLVPNESIDQNLQTYRSAEIRDDRMRNETVRGSQRPGGSLPFELSAQGWNPLWWHLLGGSVTTTGPVAGLSTPSAPTGVSAESGGTLAAASYQYKITALNSYGETLPSTASTAAVVAGSTGTVTLTWSAVAGATAYKIYGRSTYLFMATVSAGTLTWVDYGNVTPAGAVPGSNTTGQVYTHVIKGSVALPVGFTLEKGWLDLGQHIPTYGNRVARATINFNIDQIVGGTFDLLCKQMGDPTQVSLNSGAAPTRPTDKPFTSTQVSVYEGVGLTLLGTAQQLQAMVDNNLQADQGFILGSAFRTNLKPNDRVTTVNGQFQFKDMELYNEATRGDNTKLRIAAGDGTYSVQMDWAKFQFLPNNTTPKTGSSGALTIAANGEGLPDSGSGTDITVTIKSPESDITV